MIKGYAATQPKETLAPFSYEPKPLAPYDVEIAITHCGICHSDIHLIDNDWHASTYPFIPGHEIIGTVKTLGAEATHLKKGQRVGVGWQSKSCMVCESCMKGEENHCDNDQPTCVGRHGGYADRIIVDSRFAFPIPEQLKSETAAPLLCGGITVYTPLRRHATSAMTVGIIGIGGLGHLALQFAHAMGCDVVALSTSPDKEKEAKSFGADKFLLTSDTGQMNSAKQTIDLIISCVTVDLDWQTYLSLLKANGKIVFVGASPNGLNIAPSRLLNGSKSLHGSSIGNRHMIVEMLSFAARHDVKAIVEIVPLEKVNEAIEKVRQNKARYRMVLQM
jgi:uncharacterized zinc-type alcohol dehydrogenase-like protein